MKPHDARRRTLPLALLVDIAITLVGNAIAVLAIDPVARLVSAPELIALDRRIDSLLAAPNLPYAIPFPLIVVLIVVYLFPVIRDALRASVSDGATVRLLNAPFVLALFTVAGWLVGSLAFVVAALGTSLTIPAEYMLQVVFVSLILSSIAFVVIYYAVEAFNRTIVVPRLFPRGGFTDTPGLARATTRTRLIILYLVASLLPLLLLARIALLLNNEGANAFGEDIAVPIAILAAGVGAVALAITLFKATAIADPVSHMVEAAERIKRFDLDVEIPVVSTDELGLLSERLNEMVQGLRDRERMRDVFGRVVDPSVRDRLLSGEIDLGGEEVEATVLFLDVVGFTTLSESMEPADVVRLLNTLFTECAERIADAGGHIDKYIGDAVMAVFGTPSPLDNHAAAALRAVSSIRRAEPAISRALESAGYPRVALRAGIHTGRVLAGNIGSPQRIEYTVIGDAVNTASRLVTAAKEHRVATLASATTVEHAGGVPGATSVGAVALRGRREPIEAFALP